MVWKPYILVELDAEIKTELIELGRRYKSWWAEGHTGKDRTHYRHAQDVHIDLLCLQKQSAFIAC